MTPRAPALGLRANAGQFWLLVGLNAAVGATVGLERSMLPLIGSEDFGIVSNSVVLSFLIGFGAAKAVANLFAGRLAERFGRKPVLLAGWLVALPAPLLVGVAPGWGFVVAANLFLGASQGLAWSMTVLMKIDLAGPARRGLAVGLNEAAGYVGVASTAILTGALASEFAPRTVVWVGALSLILVGALVSTLAVRETGGHVALEDARGSARQVRRTIVTAAQAGFVSNLNDAVVWGLVPLYLAARGASALEIALFAGLYPAVWGVGQLGSGALSDRLGRRPPIAIGMFVQAAGLALLVAGDGRQSWTVAAAVLLGVGTALAYPTLIAAVSDAAGPARRARALGVYRFWRDAGLVAGGLGAGLVADAATAAAAIWVVSAITAASGAWAASSSALCVE